MMVMFSAKKQAMFQDVLISWGDGTCKFYCALCPCLEYGGAVRGGKNQVRDVSLTNEPVHCNLINTSRSVEYSCGQKIKESPNCMWVLLVSSNDLGRLIYHGSGIK